MSEDTVDEKVLEKNTLIVKGSAVEVLAIPLPNGNTVVDTLSAEGVDVSI